MLKILQSLIMGLGVPLIAQQINQGTQKVSRELTLITFLINKKNHVFKAIVFTTVGAIFTAIGVSLLLFSIAQQVDLQTGITFSAAMGVSIGILLLGVAFGLYGRNIIRAITHSFTYISAQESTEHPSFIKTLLATVLQSFLASKVEPRTRDHVNTRERPERDSHAWN